MLKSCRGSAPDLRARHQDAPSHGARPLDAQLASRGRDPRAPGTQPGCQCSASRRTQWPAHIAGGVPLDAQLAARDHEMMPLRPSPPSGSSSQHQGTPSHWAKHLGAQPVVLSASRGCSGHSQGAGAGRRRAPHDRPSAPGACHSMLSSWGRLASESQRGTWTSSNRIGGAIDWSFSNFEFHVSIRDSILLRGSSATWHAEGAALGWKRAAPRLRGTKASRSLPACNHTRPKARAQPHAHGAAARDRGPPLALRGLQLPPSDCVEAARASDRVRGAPRRAPAAREYARITGV